jgi:hypothetical protein
MSTSSYVWNDIKKLLDDIFHFIMNIIFRMSLLILINFINITIHQKLT